MDEEVIVRHFCDMLSRIYVYSEEGTLDDCSDEYKLSATEDGVPIRKLFIGNLAQRSTHKDLQNVFSKFGKVDSCYLKRNVGKSNYAFVTFSNVDDAMKAREEGNRKEIHLHNRDLRVMPADSWHQPDSIENQRKLAAKREKTENRLNTSECEQIQDYAVDENAPIHRLNDDCLIHVFLYLPIADRVRIERVSKRWLAVSQESWRAVKRLDLLQSTWGLAPGRRDRGIDTPTLRKVLLRCGRFLNHVDLSRIPHRLRQSTLTIVGKLCPNLQTIDVTSMNVSASGIDALTKNCMDIRKFSLGSCTSSCDNDLLKLFSKNRKLRYLRIAQNNLITGKCLAHLPSDVVEEIELDQCNAISPCHFASAVVKFNRLSSLSLNACVGLNDNAVQAISSRADSLKRLELCGYFPMMTTSAMPHAANLVNLERLNVALNPAVNDEFLIALAAQCKQLTTIDITGCCAISNEGMVAIASLPKLDDLKMSYLGKVTVEALGHLQHLRLLQCRGCPFINDQGIPGLIQACPQLEQLDLSGCELITNVTLEAAVKATKVRANSTVLKIIVGGTTVDLSELTEISPLLQIVNVDLSVTHMRPDFDHDMFFPSEDDDSDPDDDEEYGYPPSFDSNDYDDFIDDFFQDWDSVDTD